MEVVVCVCVCVCVCPHRKCPPQTGFPVLHRGAFSRSHSCFLSQSLRNPKLIHKRRMTQRSRANVSQRRVVPTHTHTHVIINILETRKFGLKERIWEQALVEAGLDSHT